MGSPFAHFVGRSSSWQDRNIEMVQCCLMRSASILVCASKAGLRAPSSVLSKRDPTQCTMFFQGWGTTVSIPWRSISPMSLARPLSASCLIMPFWLFCVRFPTRLRPRISAPHNVFSLLTLTRSLVRAIALSLAFPSRYLSLTPAPLVTLCFLSASVVPATTLDVDIRELCMPIFVFLLCLIVCSDLLEFSFAHMFLWLSHSLLSPPSSLASLPSPLSLLPLPLPVVACVALRFLPQVLSFL